MQKALGPHWTGDLGLEIGNEKTSPVCQGSSRGNAAGSKWQNMAKLLVFQDLHQCIPASSCLQDEPHFFFPGSIAIFTDMTCAFHRPAWQRRNAESLIGSRVIHRSTIQGQTEATVDTTTTGGTTTTVDTTTTGGATNGARQAPRPGVVAQLNQQGKHGKAMKLMFF